LESAPLHDIGKVGIADNILLEPGRLTLPEFEVMKQRAWFGYEILQDSSSKVLQAGAAIVLAPHEKFGGSGYPSGLKGDEIPIVGCIVPVADIFDALTAARAYKPGWPLAVTAEHIRAQSGTHFDPECATAFLPIGMTYLTFGCAFRIKTNNTG
jgi:response regulator RpfG family c-di-GMP phosphodiesterase